MLLKQFVLNFGWHLRYTVRGYTIKHIRNYLFKATSDLLRCYTDVHESSRDKQVLVRLFICGFALEHWETLRRRSCLKMLQRINRMKRRNPTSGQLSELLNLLFHIVVGVITLLYVIYLSIYLYIQYNMLTMFDTDKVLYNIAYFIKDLRKRFCLCNFMWNSITVQANWADMPWFWFILQSFQ